MWIRLRYWCHTSPLGHPQAALVALGELLEGLDGLWVSALVGVQSDRVLPVK